MTLPRIAPRVTPPLDEEFRPAVLMNRAVERSVDSSFMPLVVGLERSGGNFSQIEIKVFAEDHPRFEENFNYVERIVKFLLWQRGGYRIYIGGPRRIGEHILKQYSLGGKREFDYRFMVEQVYERAFDVVLCRPDEVPASRETGKMLGRNLQGYRIGFDLGASDLKVSAVADGALIYSEEIVWEPRKHSDPDYHYGKLNAALKTAASKLPRVDAIGGSSAGIFIDNRPMVASLFRGISAERFDVIKNMFLRISGEMGVPLEVINDGDVAALAGSMSIEDNGILGIALGSSQAAGYVNTDGKVMGWLNELAFAPIDYNSNAPVDEWSGDRGCGASYFSQQCVFRLAPKVEIEIPRDATDADKLEFVQEQLEVGQEGAIKIWQTMGVYLGYGLAHYADFYDIRHVLILGRCTSGKAGALLLQGVKQVLEAEFPEILEKIELHLPDERTRRLGQAVAAASLPVVEGVQA